MYIPAFGELKILKSNVSEGFKNIIHVYISSYIELIRFPLEETSL